MSQIFKVGNPAHVNSSSDIHDHERVRHAGPERQNAITPRIVLAATLSMCLGGVLGCGVEDLTGNPVDPSDDEAGEANIESVQSDLTAAACRLEFPFRWVCTNRAATIYQGPNTHTPHIGTLRSGSNVFQCRIEGGLSGSPPHAERWERPQGGGYVRDVDIANETNILPICP